MAPMMFDMTHALEISLFLTHVCQCSGISMDCGKNVKFDDHLRLHTGLSFPRKTQSAGDAVLRRASSTINVPGAMLMSMIAPSPSSPIISSPSSPTTPRPPPSLSSGADTNTPAIIVEADTGSWSLKDLSPVVVVPLMRRGAAKPSSTSTVSSTQPVPVSDHNMTTSTSQPTAASRAPVSTLDAATRLQHFGAMIAEMRATLLRCDLEVEPEEVEDQEDQGFRSEKGDDDDDEEDRERERVLRLLEDVTRKVKRLAEDKDPRRLGSPPRPVTIAEIEYDNSLGPRPTLQYRASLEKNVKCSQVTTH